LPRWLLPEIRPLILLGVFLLGWILLPPSFRAFFRTAAYEFQAPVWVAASHGGDIVDYWALRSRPRRELIEAGRDLSRVNAGLQLQSLENETLRAYIRRLESLLDLPEEPAFRTEVARVIRRDVNAWWHHITIRKGEDHGIPVGAAVATGFGIVGRVREVHRHTAIIELISHPSSRMAAHLELDGRPITFLGQLNLALEAPVGRVQHVAADVRISPETPRRVISSRLGGVFPEGYLIGRVAQLQPGPDGLYQVGRVNLHDNLLNLQEVSILIPVNPDR
jgi:rod shape-determining protein MreC